MTATATDTSSAPLADYFFICGIESSQIYDASSSTNANGNGGTTSPLIDSTIEEDGLPHVNGNGRPTTPAGASEAPQRRKRFSYEARKSISSIIQLDGSGTASNRSSVTIRPSSRQNGGVAESDLFDQALLRFTAERDNFLEEIQFSAGQLAQPSRPRPKPKTQRITSDDARRGDSGVGSLRRRISTMNPLSRQPTLNRRNTSARNSKRISGYNSVIPAPQRFNVQKNMHPLKRPYEPVLLDKYPTKDMADDVKRRSAFPDYVPMFVFPNDVNVVSADERPRTTWHGFAMTSGDNSKLYAICVIIWMPLNNQASVELERQCEEWRNVHMSDEEREMAKDLGERLANERAKLSELLSELPIVPSGTLEREVLEEEISSVEERIVLMTDALRPVRHGAASKIDGLTDGETGFWLPRAYGVIGRDQHLTSFWKEWLRAIVVPMTNSGVLRVPPSSPRLGTWQPLEKYVVNFCAEAPSPMTSITQTELALRELRMYARKDAINEIPGSRNVDLYALFRCLDVPDVVVLFEYLLAESRIILLSSHTSMLHLASAALTQLLFPLKWAGVFIPVLPARLIQALEAPCPYIVGIERRYESAELPEDDFVLVDLDQGVIEATMPPTYLPRQQRRKLMSILQVAAAHRYRYGVPLGPPKYATDAYPFDSFCTENPSVFEDRTAPASLSKLANLTSTSFGNSAPTSSPRPPMFNPFSQSQSSVHSRGSDRPTTASTLRTDSPPSPASGRFPIHNNAPSIPRIDSGYALQTSLREKRSGVFDASLRRNSSVYIQPLVTSKLANIADKAKFGLGSTMRRPSLPFVGHQPSPSISTVNSQSYSPSIYAPSIYAQSTVAASTVMPNVLMQPVHNTETTTWSEGHCLQWQSNSERSTCSVCDDKADDGVYRCSGCGMIAHSRCSQQICIVCPAAFHPDQIIAAFVRCFASLFYTYKKYMTPATAEQKRSGLLYHFNMDGFLRSVPHENADYMAMLRETQAFNEFIGDRERIRHDEPTIRLFDEIILSKRNRGRASMFSKSNTSFLADTSDHLWRTAAAPSPSDRTHAGHHQVIGRIPAKLDPALLREPRVVQGAPVAVPSGKAKPLRRKQVPSMLNPGMRSKSSASVGGGVTTISTAMGSGFVSSSASSSAVTDSEENAT